MEFCDLAQHALYLVTDGGAICGDVVTALENFFETGLPCRESLDKTSKQIREQMVKARDLLQQLETLLEELNGVSQYRKALTM